MLDKTANSPMQSWFLPILAAPFIGSFLGNVVRRAPREDGLFLGRSHCDHCDRVLTASDMVPLLSFVWRRGRCRRCGNWIGWFYPAIEVVAIAVAVAAVAAHPSAPSRAWIDCLLGWSLLALAWIDVDHFRLPDWLTLPLVLAGLAVTASEAPEQITDRALAAALGYLLFRAVGWGYLRWRGRDGLGEGDAKLVAAAGAWLGIGALSWLILVAAVAALIGAGLARLAGYRLNRATAIPFGPFIALAFFVLRLCPVIGI
jgi:leader peptidase (prepilin peptidase) / N-methyltransferase